MNKLEERKQGGEDSQKGDPIKDKPRLAGFASKAIREASKNTKGGWGRGGGRGGGKERG